MRYIFSILLITTNLFSLDLATLYSDIKQSSNKELKDEELRVKEF